MPIAIIRICWKQQYVRLLPIKVKFVYVEVAFFVEASIYEKFKTDFVEKVKQLKVGHPSKEDTNIGALVSKHHLEKVMQYIDISKEENGTVLYGGNKVYCCWLRRWVLFRTHSY